MFYDVFEKLCKERGTSPSAVCVEIGYAKTTSSYWKQSKRPPKREALEKIADYFGCTIEYLLGREQTVADVFGMIKNAQEKQNAPAKHSRSEVFNILGQLTDSELDEVLDFAEHLLLKRQNQAE